MNTAATASLTPYCAPCTCLAISVDALPPLGPWPGLVQKLLGARRGSWTALDPAVWSTGAHSQACACRFDTQLTELGRRQAAAKAAATSRLSPAPEVLLISPLRRTLQTAELAFPGASCPRVVEPLARERIWLSSDVGTARCSSRAWHDCGCLGMQPCTAFALVQ